MKLTVLLITALTLASCASINMEIPEDFSRSSTRMQVTGMNGWMIKQKLNFGNFRTSAVRRGWDFDGSVQYTKFRLRPEEYILKVYDINIDKRNDYHRNRFQYTINDGSQMTEVWATEKFKEKQLVYKSNNPWIGKVNRTISYEYAFTAAVVPLNQPNSQPWSLVLISKYDRSRGHWSKDDVEEEGYATNGKEHYAISPLRYSTLQTSDGETRHLLGGPLFTGYEFRLDNRLVATIDLMDRSVRMHNDLRPNQKLLLASFASAILLKRMHDVENHD